MTPPHRQQATDRPTDTLAKLMRHELAAAQTYKQAQSHLTDPAALQMVALNCASHASRATTLAELMRNNFVNPPEGPGAWGSFSKLAEKTASLINNHAVLETLRSGETHLSEVYAIAMSQLDEHMMAPVRDQCLNEQMVSEARMSQLLS